MHLIIEFPGDLRNGTFKSPWGEDGLRKKRAVELNNGRAAMMGILGKSFLLNMRCVQKNCVIYVANLSLPLLFTLINLGLMVHEQLGSNMPIIGQL